jgi:hypothetical protein
MIMITLRASWLDVITSDVPNSFEVARPQDLEGEKRRYSNLSSEIFNDSPKGNMKEGEYLRDDDENDEDIDKELERIEADDDSQLVNYTRGKNTR